MMIRRSAVAVISVLALVLGGVVVSAPAGAVVDSAVVVPSPNIGFLAPSFLFEMLVQAWDGSSWSIVANPLSVGVPARLSSVAKRPDKVLFRYQLLSMWRCLSPHAARYQYYLRGNDVSSLVLATFGPCRGLYCGSQSFRCGLWRRSL